MAKRKQPILAAEAQRRNLEQLVRLGEELRRSRLQRHLSQTALGQRTGLAQATISDIELGRGGGHTVDTWQRLVIPLGRTLNVSVSRDREESPTDAGHLAVQELVLRSARPAGFIRRFELQSSRSSFSSDVGLIDDVKRRLVLVECVNTVTDFGAAVRSSHRTRTEVKDFAMSRGGSFTIGTCWVVRDVSRNRALFRRYPEVAAAAFPGSSARWLLALTQGMDIPDEPGLLWCDVAATRLFARRAPR
jgi:transcriptional regulator with XRE-family HTH domain